MVVERLEICVRGMLSRMINIQDSKLCPFPTMECGGLGVKLGGGEEEVAAGGGPNAAFIPRQNQPGAAAGSGSESD